MGPCIWGTTASTLDNWLTPQATPNLSAVGLARGPARASKPKPSQPLDLPCLSLNPQRAPSGPLVLVISGTSFNELQASLSSTVCRPEGTFCTWHDDDKKVEREREGYL